MKLSPILVLFIVSLAGCSSAPTIDANEEIGKAVSAENKAFLGCYRKHGARKDFDTSIKYRLNFSGDIQFADIDPAASVGTSKEMGDCVLSKFKSIKLPAVEGYDGAWGTYTFRFSEK